jgi:hypothetical protein
MPLYPTYLDGKARRLGEVSMRVARLARAGTVPSKPAVRNFGYSRRDPVLRLVAVVAETGIRTRRPRGSPPRVSRVGPMGVVPQQDGIWNGGHRGCRVSCFGQAGRHGRAPEILSGGLHSATEPCGRNPWHLVQVPIPFHPADQDGNFPRAVPRSSIGRCQNMES